MFYFKKVAQKLHFKNISILLRNENKRNLIGELKKKTPTLIYKK